MEMDEWMDRYIVMTDINSEKMKKHKIWKYFCNNLISDKKKMKQDKW